MENEKTNYQTIQNQQKMLLLGLNAKEKIPMELIAQTKVATAIAQKNISSVKVSENLEKRIKDCLFNVKVLYSLLPSMEMCFTQDQSTDNGFQKKSIINALKEEQYKKYIKEYCTKLKKQKMSSENALMKFYVVNDLSANLVEIRATFKVVENGLNVLIENLEKNNVTNAEDLICHMLILILRLDTLYDIYGNYLKDIGCIEEYENGVNVFENVLDTFYELVDICEELEENNR